MLIIYIKPTIGQQIKMELIVINELNKRIESDLS